MGRFPLRALTLAVAAVSLTGEERERVAFVGDRLYTDVATGVNHGAHGLLVLSGETKLEDLEKSEVKPDGIYQSLGEMKELLERVMD